MSFSPKPGKTVLSIEAAGGIYNSIQLEQVSAVLKEHAAIIKLAEDQRLCAIVSDSNAETVKNLLAEQGLMVRPYTSGKAQPLSCIGGLCSQSKQDALKTAIDISDSLGDHSEILKVGINGCGQCCVPSHTLDISLVGEDDGYKMFIGGKNTQLPSLASFVADAIPSDKIAEKVQDVVSAYQQHAEEGEAFSDVIDRVGISPFVEALSPYSQDSFSESESVQIEQPMHSDLDLDLDDIPTSLDDDMEINLATDSLPSADDLELHDIGTDEKNHDIPINDQDLLFEEEIENQLTQSIDDIKDISVKDQNEDDREMALNFVEAENTTEESIMSEPSNQLTSEQQQAFKMETSAFIAIKSSPQSVTISLSQDTSVVIDLHSIASGEKRLSFDGEDILLVKEGKSLSITVSGITWKKNI